MGILCPPLQERWAPKIRGREKIHAKETQFKLNPIVLIATLIGFNYGANLSLFPSFAKDLWGLKNFGVNYGLVFTAWGLGGFMLSLLAGKVYDATKTFTFAYYCSAGLLVAAAAVTFLVKPPQPKAPVVSK